MPFHVWPKKLAFSVWNVFNTLSFYFSFELSYLTAPGGWVDYVTNIGANGMTELIKRQ